MGSYRTSPFSLGPLLASTRKYPKAARCIAGSGFRIDSESAPGLTVGDISRFSPPSGEVRPFYLRASPGDHLRIAKDVAVGDARSVASQDPGVLELDTLARNRLV